MRLVVLGIGVGLLLLLAACSGGGDATERVLVLGGGDITEVEFRLTVRAAFLNSTAAICAGLKGLSDEEAADAISKAQADGDLDDDLTVVQEADPDDRVRAAAIIKEECDRIG